MERPSAGAPPEPRFIATGRRGELTRKCRLAQRRLRSCRMCPRRCGVDRSAGQRGVCRTGTRAVLAGAMAHFGEEAPLSGSRGSGTIFFAHCSLGCLFCQNSDISRRGRGRAVDDAELAGVMLALQERGCHNINLVTPSHVTAAILAAVEIAWRRGLRIPLVYNSSGYDEPATLRLLNGVIDIYMPDAKFWDSGVAAELCHAPDYPSVMRAALVEMHRQVGDLELDDRGLAQRGVLVRHLVLPDGLAGTSSVMSFVARHLSTETYVNVMAQYHPCDRARRHPRLNRRLHPAEYRAAVAAARHAGLGRLDGRASSAL